MCTPPNPRATASRSRICPAQKNGEGNAKAGIVAQGASFRDRFESSIGERSVIAVSDRRGSTNPEPRSYGFAPSKSAVPRRGASAQVGGYASVRERYPWISPAPYKIVPRDVGNQRVYTSHLEDVKGEFGVIGLLGDHTAARCRLVARIYYHRGHAGNLGSSLCS